MHVGTEMKLDSFESVRTCVAMFQQQSHLIGKVSKAVHPFIGTNMYWVQQLCNLPAASEHEPSSKKGAPTTRSRSQPSVEEVLAALSGIVLFTPYDYMLLGVIGEDYDIEPVSIAEPAVKPIQLYL